MARIPSTVVLIIASVALLLTIAALVIVIPLSGRVADQARQGQRARITQCRLYPIALKVYGAAQGYHLITKQDLATYRAAGPTGCPKP